uniref:Uncharacterized protein n=1 Tax=Ananas comosus var. bracteatus TaxID=296719 RepID=A0A6V7PW94_ANACO|nr:unnamed protein product [Ananas comosus var. bracteatus]
MVVGEVDATGPRLREPVPVCDTSERRAKWLSPGNSALGNQSLRKDRSPRDRSLGRGPVPREKKKKEEKKKKSLLEGAWSSTPFSPFHSCKAWSLLVGLGDGPIFNPRRFGACLETS